MVAFMQKEIFEILKNNPLGIEVHIGDGDLEDKDYIFCDFTEERIIPSDDPCFKTRMIINVYTKDFINRKKAVQYLLQYFKTNVLYFFDKEHQYYVATLRKEVFLKEPHGNGTF